MEEENFSGDFLYTHRADRAVHSRPFIPFVKKVSKWLSRCGFAGIWGSRREGND